MSQGVTMHPFRIFAAAIFLVVGCARQPITPDVAPEAETPLDVKLYPAGNNLQYYLSEPAYVVLFAVEPAPDHRARLIYPCHPEGRARGSAGLNRVWGPGSRPQLFYTAGQQRSGQPKYLYMIASRSPLPLDRIESELYKEPAKFSVDDLSVKLASLDTLAVGWAVEEEWSSDLLATQSWPEVALPRECVP